MTLNHPTLITKEYRTLSRIAGPLIFVDRIQGVAYGEIVEITGPDGETRLGQVLEVDKQLGIVQVFAGTSGLDLQRTRVRFTGDVARLDGEPAAVDDSGEFADA